MSHRHISKQAAVAVQLQRLPAFHIDHGKELRQIGLATVRKSVVTRSKALVTTSFKSKFPQELMALPRAACLQENFPQMPSKMPGTSLVSLN